MQHEEFNSKTIMLIFLRVSVLLYFFISLSLGNDFSQWRGPNRDGKYPDRNLLKPWPKEGPKLLWSAGNLGAGHSSVAVANDRIYITGMPENKGVLYAFDMVGNLCS